MNRFLNPAIKSAFLLLLAANFGTYSANAQGNGETNPGPRLEITTTKETFRVGEVIPLTLGFTSITPDRYQLNKATYDRSGRMGYESFEVNPQAGTRDPLQLYFHSIAGFLGGGLTGFEFLSGKPTIIHLDLNEWVSIDRPGDYKLSVVSHRVADVEASKKPFGAGVELKSNTINLRIIAADPQWQTAQLQEILAGLDAAPDSKQQVGAATGQTVDQTRYAALRRLRFLDSESATRELARRIRGDDNNADHECMFGLIGSPHRRAAIPVMDTLLTDPDFPIGENFIYARAMIPLDPDEPPESLRKEFQANLDSVRSQLIEQLSGKRGKALATSLDTALGYSDSPLPAARRTALIQQMIGVFSQLPPEKQEAWLSYRWDAIKGPEWIPVLRSLAEHYEEFKQLREMHAYQSLAASGAALKRWYELDPEGARPAVIAEIVRPKPRYDANVLGMLPDKVLPEAEQAIVDHLLATNEYEVEGNLTSLLWRYAGPEMLPLVIGKITEHKGTWAGTAESNSLAYVLKVDLVAARPLLEQAISVRCPRANACARVIFAEIGKLEPGPTLEELAIQALNDPDLQVANDAALYLEHHGSAQAEQPLLARYEALSKEWKGRDSEFQFVFGRDNPNTWVVGLARTLMQALSLNTEWLADETKLRQIEALAFDDETTRQAKVYLDASAHKPLQLFFMFFGGPQPHVDFELAQYQLHSLEELKKKLGQYPQGTNLEFSAPVPSTPEEVEKTYREIADFASKNGLRLTRAAVAQGQN
jgi:hypothetical protein